MFRVFQQFYGYFSEKPKKPSMMVPLMTGIGATLLAMVPLTISGLAILSAKALLASKFAMVVSLIIFFQYFFNYGKVSANKIFLKSFY